MLLPGAGPARRVGRQGRDRGDGRRVRACAPRCCPPARSWPATPSPPPPRGPLGGVVLAAGGALCAREWSRQSGTRHGGRAAGHLRRRVRRVAPAGQAGRRVAVGARRRRRHRARRPPGVRPSAAPRRPGARPRLEAGQRRPRLTDVVAGRDQQVDDGRAQLGDHHLSGQRRRPAGRAGRGRGRAGAAPGRRSGRPRRAAPARRPAGRAGPAAPAAGRRRSPGRTARAAPAPAGCGSPGRRRRAGAAPGGASRRPGRGAAATAG